MTYPRPSSFGPAADARHAPAPSVRRAEPALPRDRARDRSRSGRPTTPSARRSTSATAPRSGSSTTARRSRTACRTTATCSPATRRTSSRASRPCAARRSIASSAGTRTACPAELEAMKQLGITEKSEIEAMGIDAFNAKARESVLAYTHEWEDYVTRQARWVDFERGYKTLDTSRTWSPCCGRSRRSTTRVSRTRATACCRTAGATRRRCRRTSCAWTTTSTRCARTRRSRSRSR